MFKNYIDDTGGKEYNKNYPYDYSNVSDPLPWSDQSTDFWRENYLVLCAIRVEGKHIDLIDKEIRKLKIDCFGTDDVEIKSTWLRSPENRKVKYVDPYKVSDERVKKLGDDFIDLIARHHKEMKIIAVVFDKRCIKNREMHHPLLKTTQLILERIHYSGGENHIVFDQMDSTLTIKKGNGKKMIQVLTGNVGVQNIYVEDYSSIKNMIPQDSKKENFIQVSDACSYAIYKQFLKYGREWYGTKKENDKFVLTTDPVFEKLAKNFYYNKKNKEVVGYGLSLFPHDKNQRVSWDFGIAD